MRKKLVLIIFMMIIAMMIPEYVSANTDRSNVIYSKADNEQILQEGGVPFASFKLQRRKKTKAISEKIQKHIESDLKKAWDNFEPKCDLSQYHISMQDIWTVIGTILNENSKYFYVELGYAWGSGVNNEVKYVELSYNDTKDNVRKKNAAYEEAIAKAVSAVNPAWSDFEKALYLNDYLATHCYYDETYSKYSAYNALVEGTAVCQGYSLAYQALLKRVGISCEVIGSSSLNHAWNFVTINGKYYHVDVTWNDPVGNIPENAGHRFFMKSTAFMRTKEGGHLVADDWTTDSGIDIGQANDTTYDYAMNDIDTPFVYANGKWINYDGANAIEEYQYKNDIFTKNRTILTINDQWDYIDDNGGYWCWEGSFAGFAEYDNKEYYSTSDKIYLFNLEDETSKLIFELSDYEAKYGCIFGISIDKDGTLFYDWRKGTGDREKKVACVLDKQENIQHQFDTCYQVCFDGNGDDIINDWMSNLDCVSGQAYELPKNTFTKKGYIFIGWNTARDGSGAIYSDRAQIKDLVKENYGKITLYAQWKKVNQSQSKSYKIVKKIKRGKQITLTIPSNNIKVNWKVISGKKYIKIIKKTKTAIIVKGIKKGKVCIQGIAKNKVLSCNLQIE